MYMVQIQNDDLVHYGILGMKWGIRRYQPYSVKPRGSGEGGKEVGEARRAERREKRFDKAQQKMSKIDTKYQKAEKKTQKQFTKAERKSIRVFSTQKGVDRALNKAMRARKVTNKYAYKGKTLYEKILKKYPDMELDPATVERGMKFLTRSEKNADILYTRMLNDDGLRKKRR